MKKVLAILLALTFVVAAVGCTESNVSEENKENTANAAVEETEEPVEETEEPVEETGESVEETEEPVEETEEPVEETEEPVEEVKVMSYDEYMAAEVETAVVVEAYVQGKQAWWENKANVYAQDENGGYFFYEMACSEEDYEKLEVGTKIRVTGFKGEWSGEIEVIDCSFEIVEAEPYVAVAEDVTALLGTDELESHMNKVVSFKGLTVVGFEYAGDIGSDIYLTLSDGTNNYDFCVESYLTGVDTEVYQTVSALKAGDVVDIKGFLYWYNGANPHITSVTVVTE